MLRKYQTAKHIITIHRAGMQDREYAIIIARIRHIVDAKDYALVETASIAYVIFGAEVKALRTMCDLHGLGTIGYTSYVSHRASVQYNFCENGLADFYPATYTAPTATN